MALEAAFGSVTVFVYFSAMQMIRIINQSPYPLPAYETSMAAGMDLRAVLPTPLVLGSLERAAVPTGIFLELPAGHEAQIRPRSGLALRHGLSLVNSPGTIDADYRGEIKVLLVNLSNEPCTIQPGDRIAQMVIARFERIEWEEVQALSTTERGSGGFGHTGTS